MVVAGKVVLLIGQELLSECNCEGSPSVASTWVVALSSSLDVDCLRWTLVCGR
jgi:hypothetical protein